MLGLLMSWFKTNQKTTPPHASLPSCGTTGLSIGWGLKTVSGQTPKIESNSLLHPPWFCVTSPSLFSPQLLIPVCVRGRGVCVCVCGVEDGKYAYHRLVMVATNEGCMAHICIPKCLPTGNARSVGTLDPGTLGLKVYWKFCST